MKTRHYHSILVAMALATISIMVLQGYIWRQSIEREQQRFDDSVERAVTRLSYELQNSDSKGMLVFNAITGGALNESPLGSSMKVEHLFTASDTFTTRDTLHRHVQGTDIDSLFFSILKPGGIVDSLRKNVTIRIQSDCKACDETLEFPAVDRIRPILEERLALDGIDGDFDFGVMDVSSGIWVIDPDNPSEAKESKRNFVLHANLSDDLQHGEAELRLFFPDEKWHVLRKMATSLVLSGLLALGVLACLGFALQTIRRQKLLSEIKTDFINNMTHELKTPIATISLASEALADDSVEFPPEKRADYINMISTEADRLSDQVEKVLQMSLIDKGDLGLNLEAINLQLLIEEIVESFKLKVQRRKGSLELNLDAAGKMIEGDRMHVRQMLSNLLDNAEKYSPKNPELEVRARAMEEGIEIAVSDRGVGIGRDKLKRIFDRFYRIPSGDVHDVKGFGLGLSYVMSMARAHGGSVRATSKLGKGSTFYLTLPYANV